MTAATTSLSVAPVWLSSLTRSSSVIVRCGRETGSNWPVAASRSAITGFLLVQVDGVHLSCQASRATYRPAIGRFSWVDDQAPRAQAIILAADEMRARSVPARHVVATRRGHGARIEVVGPRYGSCSTGYAAQPHVASMEALDGGNSIDLPLGR